MKGAGRVPPHDLAIERAVLGTAISRGREAIDEAADVVGLDDWYSEANHTVWEAMLKLANRGVEIDVLTLRDELRAHQRLERAGGEEYLLELTSELPVAPDHVATHAQIVADLGAVRRMIMCCHEVAAKGYGVRGDIRSFLDHAEALIFAASREPRAGAGLVKLSDGVSETYREIEAASQSGGVTGLRTGIDRLDAKTTGLHGGELVIIAGRPGMGKTAFGLGLAIEAGREGHPVAVFEAEMMRRELRMRALSREARIEHNRLRAGSLSQGNWEALAAAGRAFDALPVFIDDSARPTVMRIRSGARRLKAKLGSLGLVLVDYIQLVASGMRHDSREEEVAEVSRGLKQLAKELDVPVVALAQLNRGPESRGRGDKRPTLADLRECLTADALVTDADTGDRVRIADVAPGQRVLAMDESCQRIVSGEVTEVFGHGMREVFRVRTKGGREIVGTSNHPFFTADGWRPLGQLKVGDDVATHCGGRLPTIAPDALGPDLCRLLGYMCGDGTCKKHREVGFVANKADADVLDDFRQIIGRHFPGCQIRSRDRYGATQVSVVQVNEAGHGKPHGNAFREWLREVGLHGQDAFTKRVPGRVFRSGARGMAEFINGYLHTDGTVKRAAGNTWRIAFSSCSLGLLEDVRTMLDRLGVPSNLGAPAFDQRFRSAPLHTLMVSSTRTALEAFWRAVEPRFRKGKLLHQALVEGPNATTAPGAYALPRSVSQYLATASRRAGLHWTETWRDQGKRLRRETAREWAQKLSDPTLAAFANSDLIWEEVVAIEPAGREPVYDLRVQGFHSFVANGLVVHNSGQLEQDADVVLFLFREEMYRKDLPQVRGIAEVIIGKQRNGPLGTIRTRFAGHYMRFDNLAEDYYGDDDFDSSDFDDSREPAQQTLGVG